MNKLKDCLIIISYVCALPRFLYNDDIRDDGNNDDDDDDSGGVVVKECS